MKEERKKILKVICFQALLVNFGIVLLNGIIGGIFTLTGNNYSINVLFLIGSIIVSIVTACGSIIFNVNVLKNVPFIVKLIIHYILLGAIVMLASYLFGWTDFTTFLYPFLIFGIYSIIYIFVWIVTKIKYLNEEENINIALRNNNDDDD